MNTHPSPSLTTTRADGIRGLLGRAAMFLAMILSAGSALGQAANSAPPDRMSYQGFLVDASGVPIANAAPANFTTIFRIYPAPLNGALLWSEQQLVTIDKGNFSVILGEGSAASVLPGENALHGSLAAVFTANGPSDRYIEVTVAGTRILPRLRLLPTSYAFLASAANGLVQSPTGAPFLSYDTTAGLTTVPNSLSVTGNVTLNKNLVAGTVSASSLFGNGAGITGLTASQIGGAAQFPDSLLSPNVALRNAANQFSTYQNILGNLGLGISSVPGFPLTFGSTFGDKISLYPGAASTYGIGVQSGALQIHTDVSASDVVFGYGASASMTEVMRIKGTGRVGIGTANPLYPLHISGSSSTLRLVLENTAAGGHQWGVVSDSGGYFSIFETNTYRLVVAPTTGNVGIGTTQPTERLEVAGRIKMAGGATGAAITAAGSTEALRIVRGQVSGAGAVTIGTGFTVTRNAPGVYTVSFSPAFGDTPIITFHVAGTMNQPLVSQNGSKFTITTSGSTGLPTDLSFSFIAVGAP